MRAPVSAGGSSNILSEPFSLYLDLLRFGAALVVALSHTWRMLVPAHPLPWPGHDAVVVFFVLSGLVVAHATDSVRRPASVYIQHRLARLWSVALPALALSLVAAALVPTGVEIYAAPPLDHQAMPWVPPLLSAVFLAQSWSLDLVPPFNAPFWSLSFEAWYYALFGVLTYAPRRWRLPALAVGACIAGPKILLLMPIWLMGVAICRARIRLPRPVAAVLFGLSILLALAFVLSGASIAIRNAMAVYLPALIGSLHGANQFVGDILLGLIVSVNFVAASNLASWLASLRRIKGPCRSAASFTFSIYLYHMPLFSLIWGVLGVHSAMAAFPALAAGIVALGLVTERQLPLWRGWAARAASWLTPGSRAVQGAPGSDD
ncbi:acyltransferase family protein [Aliidongia dinghuensis]|nr:acyltransferase [Aliidongia dinghuensis]